SLGSADWRESLSFLLSLALRVPPRSTLFPCTTLFRSNIQKDIAEKGLEGKMIMQVHDELVFDVPNHEIDEFKAIIENRMKNAIRSEEHTSELQSRENLVCRRLLEKEYEH